VTLKTANIKTAFTKESYMRQSGTAETAKIQRFDRFPCTVSRVSGVLLHYSGETVSDGQITNQISNHILKS